MASGRKRLFTVAAGDPRRLGAFLAARLELAPAAAGALVEEGRVYVGGRRVVDPRLALDPGLRVVLHVAPPLAVAPAWRVVHEDEWLLIVDKPAGLASQATRRSSADALDALVRQTRPAARLMHRLDRAASGLLLLAARAEACAPLQAAFDAGLVERGYLAVVSGHLDGQGTIDLRIGRHSSDERLRRALPHNDPSGEPASSRYRVLRQGPDVTLVELELDTGRTHQLRVHLAAIGHAILGDPDYAGPAAPRLLLHAHRLRLPHPQTGELMAFSSPPPPVLLGAADLGAASES